MGFLGTATTDPMRDNSDLEELYDNLNDEELGEVMETIREWVDGTYRRLRSAE